MQDCLLSCRYFSFFVVHLSTACHQDESDLLVLALAQAQLCQDCDLALVCIPSMLPHLMCNSPSQTPASSRRKCECLQVVGK